MVSLIPLQLFPTPVPPTATKQINKLSKPIVPARQIGPPTRQLTAEFNPEPTSLQLGGRRGLA